MANPSGKGGFQKGHSGNPAGRPRKEREERFYEIAVSAVSYPQWRKIVEKAAAMAERGDATARKWLSDYLMGTPIQRMAFTDREGNDVTFRVVYENKE